MVEIIQTYIVSNYIDIVGSAIGLLYLYLEYKASIWMWLVSIIMAIFFIYIFYSSQLYASMTIYAYFLMASSYGWISWWKKGKQQAEENTPHILRIPKRQIVTTLIAVCVSFGIIYFLLDFTTKNTRFIMLGDALTTALNVVALWLATRKWAEQWCLVIPANLLSGILLMVQGEYASSIMFYIYFIVSIFGYFNWVRLSKART